MPLNPPRSDRVVLRRSPLKLIVAQLRFTSILSIQRQEFVAGFQEDIRGDYPVLEQQQGVQVQLPAPVPSPPIVVTSTLWRFLSPDRKWVAALAPDFLALETEAYGTFADFAARFEVLLAALVSRFRPSQQVRLGLRYVNQFSSSARPEPRNWQTFIRPELLGALVSESFGSGVAQARQDIRVRQEDGWFVLRLALSRQEEGEPSAIVLDFDYYDEEQRQLDPVDISQKLSRYNDVIYRMFRWAVLQPLLEEFEPEHENN